MLTPIKISRKENKTIYWLCLCDCGEEKEVSYSCLVRGYVKSCGCNTRNLLREASKKRVLLGSKYHKLTVIKELGQHENRRFIYLCLCDCGNYTNITSSDLGRTKSCGCLKRIHCNNINKNKRIKAGCDPNIIIGNRLSSQRYVKRQKHLFSIDKDLKRLFYIRQHLSYLRNFALERDNYTCQMCLGKSLNLICHHILPVKFAPDRVDDLNNLICLCKRCHIKAHSGNYKLYDPIWADLALERNYSLVTNN